MLPVAVEAMIEAAREHGGNPSSLHWAGRAARRLVDDARDKLAASLGVEPGSVVFTSGGTEANNAAIRGVLEGAGAGRVVTSAIEHPSVLEPLNLLARLRPDLEIVRIRPEADGRVDAGTMAAAMTESTRLVCLMAANNETGVLQPVGEIVRIARERGIPVLVDAVQAFGRVPPDPAWAEADMLSLSAHKIGGPKGVGALIVRRGLRLAPLLAGGGQERGRRSGTENVPGIAGFAAAIGEADFAALAAVRDHFEKRLGERLPDVRVLGQSAPRLPNTSLVLIPGTDGETLLMQLDLEGFAVASGSACSSGKQGVSHVLLAMGLDEATARGSLRVSFPPGATIADADALVEALVRVRARLDELAGLMG